MSLILGPLISLGLNKLFNAPPEESSKSSSKAGISKSEISHIIMLQLNHYAAQELLEEASALTQMMGYVYDDKKALTELRNRLFLIWLRTDNLTGRGDDFSESILGMTSVIAASAAYDATKQLGEEDSLMASRLSRAIQRIRSSGLEVLVKKKTLPWGRIEELVKPEMCAAVIMASKGDKSWKELLTQKPKRIPAKVQDELQALCCEQIKKQALIPWTWIADYVNAEAWKNQKEKNKFFSRWKALPTAEILRTAKSGIAFTKKCGDVDILIEMQSYEMSRKNRVTVLRAIDDRLVVLASA